MNPTLFDEPEEEPEEKGPVVDPTTGEVIGEAEGDGSCKRCEDERKRADAIAGDLDMADKEVRSLRRRVTRLETELRKQTTEAPEMGAVRQIYDIWVDVTERDPRRTKLGEKRTKIILARIREGYHPDYIAWAVCGLPLSAYTNPDTGVRYDDIELVCRDEVHLERFYAAASRLLPPDYKRPEIVADDRLT